MKKALLIAEKPSLMRTIEEAYNKHASEINYDIDFTNQRGHLCTLKQPNELDASLEEWSWNTLPFHPEQYGGWKYKVIKEKKQGNFLTAAERYKAIKDALSSGKYDFVINAGDPDQEGELLIRIVLSELKCSLPIKRFWTNDLTEFAIVNALQNLGDDEKDPMFVHLLQAAYGRQHSDYRFGMNLSRAGTLKMNGRVALGRVKTPILAIVCQRELDIQNFKPTTTYGVKTNYKEGFSGQYFMSSNSDDEDEDAGLVYFDTEDEANDFIKQLQGNNATVTNYESKKVETLPPKLFKLATAQIAAGSYGYSADKTLEIIQSLYEKTYISYPRTDCEYISSHEELENLLKSSMAVPELVPFIKTIDKAAVQKVRGTKKWVNDKKLEDSGHSALIPTINKPDFSKLTPDEQIIYKMIARQFVSVFLPNLVQNKVTLLADIDGNLFKTNGKTLVNAGYTEIFGNTFKDTDIPAHKKGDTLDVDGFDIVKKTTTCPKRFTSPDLIALCENPKKYLFDDHLKNTTKELKIGTPATRASIIKGLITLDKYLTEKTEGKKKYIYPTENGMLIYENLKDTAICRVDLTAEWEEMLEQVRQGRLTLEELEKQMIETVNLMVDEFKGMTMKPLAKSKFPLLGKCPLCGGDVFAHQKGFFCGNFKSNGCKYGGYRKILDTVITESQLKKLVAGEEIEVKLCKKGGNPWMQKIKYDTTSLKIEFVQQQAQQLPYSCPKCGKALVEDGNYIKCDDGCFKFWKTPGNKSLTDNQLETLFKNGETDTIFGFKSKKGRSFPAKLKISADKSTVEFDFD